MKNTILGFMLLALIFASACKKTTTTPASTATDTWYFKNSTYTSSTLNLTQINGSAVLNANDSAENNYMWVYFAGSTLPTSSGTYTVVNANADSISFSSPTAHEVGIVEFSAEFGSYSTGGNGTQTVSVSVSPTGKVSVSGSNIEIDYRSNNIPTADSTTFTFSIAQQ